MKRPHSSLAGRMAKGRSARNWQITNGQQTTGVLPWFVRFTGPERQLTPLNRGKPLVDVRSQPGKFLPWSDQNDK